MKTNNAKEGIMQLIASGEYQPGDKIPTEIELSKRFRCSRSTIREAVKIFNYLGVLKSKTAVGTFVCEATNISKEAIIWSILLNQPDLKHILELREVFEKRGIECLVNDGATIKGKSIVNSLGHILLDMRNASTDYEYEKLVQRDYDFHLKIVEGSSNPLFISIYKVLGSFLQIEMGIALRKDNSRTLRLHEAILNNIKQKRLAMALEAYDAHMKETYRKILKGKNVKALKEAS